MSVVFAKDTYCAALCDYCKNSDR